MCAYHTLSPWPLLDGGGGYGTCRLTALQLNSVSERWGKTIKIIAYSFVFFEYFSVQEEEEESGSESPSESGEEGGNPNEETGEDNVEKNNNQGEKFAKKSAMNLEEDHTSDEEVLHVVVDSINIIILMRKQE